MGTGRQYDEEFKKQAVKLAKEIGNKAAAEELGIPKGTLGTWLNRARAGEIDTGAGTRSPDESLNWDITFESSGVFLPLFSFALGRVSPCG